MFRNENNLCVQEVSDFNQNYIDELKHFIGCCKGDESPLALQDGIETMELILAAYKSVETKSLVEI